MVFMPGVEGWSPVGTHKGAIEYIYPTEGGSDSSGFLFYSVLADKNPKAIALAESLLTNF